MLIVDRRTGEFRDSSVSQLPAVLRPRDLLIVNDAATLPASLPARGPSGSTMEIRLLHHLAGSDWKAILMGDGDWRTPTELRDLPETAAAGSTLEISETFTAEILKVEPESPCLVTLRFSREGIGMWTGIYAHGRPVQYSYLKNGLALWSVQTAYASRPWTAEMPSAGYPLAWSILLELKRRGVGMAWLTHAAGLSATGDEDLDSLLPFPERFEIPQSTVDAIAGTRRTGGRIIAVGTTVVRALEGCFGNKGDVVAGPGQTDLVLGRDSSLQVLDGILTGVHDPAQSHFRLLRAFAGEAALRKAWRHALEAGYMCHEFGDVCLIV
jgi:S-adenosylmethionine:tRNA ribosyltransferase-isomerase